MRFAVLFAVTLLVLAGAAFFFLRPGDEPRSSAPARLAAAPQPDMMAPAEAPAAESPAAPSTGATAAAPAAAPADPIEQLYRHGHYGEALQQWQAAADAGNAQAAYRLGKEYMDGKPGVTQRKLPEAVTYLTRAAEAGIPQAEFDLATLYEVGGGVQPSLQRAAELYKSAAQRGHPQAQYNVGTMYEAGEGVAQDKIQALAWYLIAAKSGFRAPRVNDRGKIDNSAPDPLEALERSLPAEQVLEAQKRADAFQPKP